MARNGLKTGLFVYRHCDHFDHSKWNEHNELTIFECVRMRMSVWIEIFEIVRFEIKIIFCEIKEI